MGKMAKSWGFRGRGLKSAPERWRRADGSGVQTPDPLRLRKMGIGEALSETPDPKKRTYFINSRGQPVCSGSRP